MKRTSVALSSSLRKERLPLCDGKITLTSIGVTVKGKPTLDEFKSAWSFAQWSERSSAWWVVGLLDYASTRKDWADQLESVMDFTGYSEGRVRSLRTISRTFPPERRQFAVDLSVYEAVAPLSPKEQDALLEQAETENLSVRAVQQAVNAKRRRKVLDGQAVLEGRYRVIYADPWSHVDPWPRMEGASSVADLCRLPIASHAMPHSALWLWVPPSLLYQSPGPREVGMAWGFTYQRDIVWDAVDGQPCDFSFERHQHLTIWTRGQGMPDTDGSLVKSVQTIRSRDAEKPSEFYGLIEKLYTTGPYLQVYASQPRTGWSTLNNS